MSRGNLYRAPLAIFSCASAACFALGGCGSSSEPAVIDASGPCQGARLPDGQYYVQPGLCVRAVARQQSATRQITFSPEGELIAVRSNGDIVRYRDLDQNGVFEGPEEIKRIASTGGMNGNNAHIDGGFLYAGSQDGVKRWAYSKDAADLGPGEDVVVGQPSTGTHSLHTVHVYDSWLYVHSGSEDNAVAPAAPEYDTNRSVLKRFYLADFRSGTPFQWSAGEVVVKGIRNMVGFTRNGAGKMYGVVNGLDNLMYQGLDVHADNPGDDLIAIEPGAAHGYPYCFTTEHIVLGGNVVAPGMQLGSATDPEAPDPDFSNPHDDTWCAQNSSPPATFTPAHAAPLDIAFLDSSKTLPAEWQGNAFVALHGSWDTPTSVGHKVILVSFDPAGRAEQPTATVDSAEFPFKVVFGGGNATTPIDGRWGWSSGDWGEDPVRPVGVAVSPVDGALYVSSDNGPIVGSGDTAKQGMIYRIRMDH
jgi:glucose/arabinose dehydrogenase